ncbi:amino acid permease [Nakamurella sp. YIM 132087]|uniref:Amino acid permease n=1 Tax=Nakamurella alba TaxID=2665158 RepID=A0A7K1FJ08_9ACTN|nr:amino acid permease [Nakamurella alba]MTD14092.1 amino acid permease [Nakamurella alba]
MGRGVWRTKTVEQSIQDTDEPGHKLKRSLGAWDLTVFGVAVVIGAGIFTLTARVAATTAGPSVSLGFVIAAIACGLAAVCYAEFASTVPVAGSAYTFSYATLGELIAWIIGWDLVLELALGASVVAKGWSLYLSDLFAEFGGSLTTTVDIGFDLDWGAMLIVLVITGLLTTGAKVSARANAIITAIKVAVVLLVIVVGFFYFKADNLSPFIPPAVPADGGADGGTAAGTLEQPLLQLITGGAPSSFGVFGVLSAASLVFFAFIGFDVVATAAEETRNPGKDVPRGILGSLVIVTVLYVLVTVVLTGMVSYTELPGDDATLSSAFSLVGNGWAAKVIAIGALAGLTTVVLVLMLGQSRIIFAMSRDGLLPRGIGSVSPRSGVPVRITVGVGVVVAIIAGVSDIGVLEEMVNVGTLFAFVLVSIGVIVLRRTRPDLPRSFKVPLMPVIPILAVIACLWLMINLTAITWIRFLIWMAIGVIVYFLYGRRHSRLGKQGGSVLAGQELDANLAAQRDLDPGFGDRRERD